MYGRTLVALAAALGLFTLAACGGGGGDGAPMAANPTPAPQTPATQADRNSIRIADTDRTLQAARGAADSLPRFGSVTQSTNADANGVTTDRARAAFDGAGMTVTVTRENGSTLRLDTADAIEDTGAQPDTLFLIPGAARTARAWGTSNIADRAATVARLAVTAANGAPSDWLAGGYWLHLAGQNLLTTAPTITHADMGAFVDGPELRSPPTLPATGTARYEGNGSGAYVTRYGTGFAGTAPGSTEIGEFTGTATLTADFADNTISGCFGCRGDVLLSGVFEDGATGAQRTFVNTPTDYQIRLGAARVNADGTFSVRDVTLSSVTLRQQGFGITEQGGSWGGKFSNIPVATGEPRLVAGTFGGRATITGGSEGVYVGAFGAGKQ